MILFKRSEEAAVCDRTWRCGDVCDGRDGRSISGRNSRFRRIWAQSFCRLQSYCSVMNITVPKDGCLWAPFSFQPSEYAKVAVILFLAYLVTRNVERRLSSIWTMLRIMLCVLPVVGLVGASNLSTAIIILGIAAVLIFVASPRYAQFIWMGVLGCGFMAVFLALESYRLERIAIWRNPEQYEKGYQTLQGLYAIGSGGLFGRGLGESIQKLGFVPEAQNDMIFSIICEELGLVGAGFVLILFLILIWRFFVIATHAEDLFGALIGTGAMAHMMIQVILNISVVTNTIPNTGITLPFISYGGTSVVFLLLEMGLVLSVSAG